MRPYTGPIRCEPLPIELHNTLYAVRGEAIDGLADASGLRAWVAGQADRLPSAANWASSQSIDANRLEDFWALRGAVREALHAVVEEREIPDADLTVLNRWSAHSCQSPRLTKDAGRLAGEVRYHATTPTDLLLGLLAAGTIALVSGPQARDLRACGAPGCVLMFLKDHPRREWCSATCGNRARQARHYARSKEPRRGD
jgi:predicted RNA-binding Zn ribbon-like protein